LDHSRKGRVDLAFIARIQNMQLQPERTCCIPHFFGFRLGIYGVGRVDEQRDDGSCGHQFVQELKPLCDHGDIEDAYARDVAARPVEGRRRDQL